MYRKSVFYRGGKRGVYVIAKNGVAVAECTTDAMADKIIRGLELYADDELKKKQFRL